MSEPPAKRDDEPAAASRWAVPGCVTLRCRRDGPLVIELAADARAVDAQAADAQAADAQAADAQSAPAVRIIDHEGREFPLPTDKRAVALCRCGHSATKPFCDGSHREQGFAAAEEAV
jgi:CDGSH-type Zn-finger protein